MGTGTERSRRVRSSSGHRTATTSEPIDPMAEADKAVAGSEADERSDVDKLNDLIRARAGVVVPLVFREPGK